MARHHIKCLQSRMLSERALNAQSGDSTLRFSHSVYNLTHYLVRTAFDIFGVGSLLMLIITTESRERVSALTYSSKLDRLHCASPFRLNFPLNLSADAAAATLRVAAAEARGTWLRPAPPLTFETLMRRGEVTWWVSGRADRVAHLRSAARRELPGVE